jgi:predicted nucleotide-binding protein
MSCTRFGGNYSDDKSHHRSEAISPSKSSLKQEPSLKQEIDVATRVACEAIKRLVALSPENILSLSQESQRWWKEHQRLDRLREVSDALNKPSSEDLKMVNCRVFIVHGHSEAKRRELKDLLKNDLNLDPIVLMDEPDEGSITIIEKFERYAPTCAYAIIILTPDDLIDKNGETYLQARPNVLMELGWFMAHLGRNKVLLLVQGDSKIPSDLSGVLTKRFNRDISEIGLNIKRELDRQNVNRK